MPGDRRPHRQHDRQQRRRVRGDAREQVVREEEDRDQDDERHHRRDAAHVRGDRLGEPLDEADAVEPVGERDQRREPDERVPRLLVAEHVVPPDRPGDSISETTSSATVVALIHLSPKIQSASATTTSPARTSSRRMTLPIAEQLLRGPGRHLAASLHLGRIDPVDEERGHEQEADADRRERDEPLHPGDVDLRRLPRELEREQVRRERGDEHRARHAGHGERGPHEVAADPPCRRIVRQRLVERRQVLDHREDRAAGARGVRRRERREQRRRRRSSRSRATACACPSPAPARARSAGRGRSCRSRART